MRMASAASIRPKKGRGGAPTQAIPRPGTKIRALYDLLMSNKGHTVNIPATNTFVRDKKGSCFTQLRDFYGLDIRTVGPNQYILVGEWFGRVYVDYLSESMEDKNG